MMFSVTKIKHNFLSFAALTGTILILFVTQSYVHYYKKNLNMMYCFCWLTFT